MGNEEKDKSVVDYSTMVTMNAQRFSDLITKVEALALAGIEKGFHGDIFYLLANYAEGSLLDEELALMNTDAATRQEHQLLHAKFLARLEAIRKGLEQGNPHKVNDTLTFLHSWYNEHFKEFHGLSS